jgi:hypothetical protein
MDDSSLPQLFYPTCTEQLISSAFSRKFRKLCRILSKAQNTLLPDQYFFEIENAYVALDECGEVEVKDWIKQAIQRFDDCGNYFY